MPANGPSRNQLNQVTKRTKATIWTAIAFAIAYAIILATSTAWEGTVPQWAAGALEHRAGLLALLAATFGLLSIVIPNRAMPKAFQTTVVTGGLTGYAAVINAFDPLSKEVAIVMALTTFPILAVWTSVWRMPRRWEWAGWSVVRSAATLAVVTATVNTPLAVLIVTLFGKDTAVAMLALATVISTVVLIVALFALVVKAKGIAQASENNRGRHR